MEKNRKRQRRNRNTTVLYKAMAIIFCAVIAFLTVISIIIPDKEYSAEENRVLAEFPDFSFQNLMDTKYMTGLESYVSDHFVLRDFWINIKVKCDLLVGKTELNGVYLGDDNYLMQIPTEPNQENVDRNMTEINNFAQKYESLDVNMMVVPNAVSTMSDYLPKGAPVRDQRKDTKALKEKLTESVDYIDVSETLKKHVDEGMYYKTDHHWTSRAAYYAFLESTDHMGISEPVTDYDVYMVSNEFSGTLASKSGYHKEEDTVEIYAPSNTEVDYVVTGMEGKDASTSIYDKGALKEKDKYQVFLGGNSAKIEINTTNETRERLLIFKDSYANCFVPFLLPYYNEIIMVDPRYYYDDVHSLIKNEQITDVLFLYNMDTFLNDNSLADVLVSE
ncbi:MAG: hypothetical protein J5983_05860 [Ruminococcus sp.]|nr:hypothetical protein [Ruminococcus sp.]